MKSRVTSCVNSHLQFADFSNLFHSDLPVPPDLILNEENILIYRSLLRWTSVFTLT